MNSAVKTKKWDKAHADEKKARLQSQLINNIGCLSNHRIPRAVFLSPSKSPRRGDLEELFLSIFTYRLRHHGNHCLKISSGKKLYSGENFLEWRKDVEVTSPLTGKIIPTFLFLLQVI